MGETAMLALISRHRKGEELCESTVSFPDFQSLTHLPHSEKEWSYSLAVQPPCLTCLPMNWSHLCEVQLWQCCMLHDLHPLHTFPWQVRTFFRKWTPLHFSKVSINFHQNFTKFHELQHHKSFGHRVIGPFIRFRTNFCTFQWPCCPTSVRVSGPWPLAAVAAAAPAAPAALTLRWWLEQKSRDVLSKWRWKRLSLG